jgi:hypothetical protein
MSGKYRTIVADPPWPIGEFPLGPSRRAVEGPGTVDLQIRQWPDPLGVAQGTLL